jgi:hypothetical protein
MTAGKNPEDPKNTAEWIFRRTEEQKNTADTVDLLAFVCLILTFELSIATTLWCSDLKNGIS